MSLEHSNAFKFALELPIRVEAPQTNLVVFGASEHEALIALRMGVNTQKDVRVARVQLDVTSLHVVDLQSLTVAAENREVTFDCLTMFVDLLDELDVDNFVKKETLGTNLLETGTLLLLNELVREQVLVLVDAVKLVI